MWAHSRGRPQPPEACACGCMCVHAHVREQELEDRYTVTLTDGIKEPVLLLGPWSMRLHKIGCKKLVQKQRKGLHLDDGDGEDDNDKKR